MPKEKKEERIERLQKWWLLSENAYNPWQTEAMKDLDFYLGGEKQWESVDLQKLKAENRPALTLNHILPLINLISGYQRQNRQDIKIFNRRGGTRAVADIFTELIKHIHDNCYGDWENSMNFLLGLITGIGWIGLDIDYDEDLIYGDIVMENVSPFKVYPDPFFERYDMSDAEFIFRISWLPKSRIEKIYPDKKKDLENLSTSEKDKQTIPYVEGDKYHDAEGSSTTTAEIEKYRYRVKQCWWREYEVQKFLVGIESGIVRRVDLPEERIKSLMKMHPTIRVIRRVRPVLNLTTYVGNVELEHTEDPFEGMTRFPLIPFFCYWIENNHFGVVNQLKDPQKEINKRRSQALHHLNQSANSGWIADDNALTPDQWEELQNFGSKPGMTIKKKPNSHLERVTPTMISEGHLRLSDSGKQDIRDISGINPDLAGLPSDKQTSGYLMELRRNQGLIAIESIFDNYRLTKQVLGRTLIDLIQHSKAYSREEVLSLVVDGKEKSYPINQRIIENGVDKVLNDVTSGKYHAVVSQSPNTPTTRMRNFYMLMEAVKSGMPIPPDILIESSDLPMKEEIKQRMAMPPANPADMPGPGGNPALPAPVPPVPAGAR